MEWEPSVTVSCTSGLTGVYAARQPAARVASPMTARMVNTRDLDAIFILCAPQADFVSLQPPLQSPGALIPSVFGGPVVPGRVHVDVDDCLDRAFLHLLARVQRAAHRAEVPIGGNHHPEPVAHGNAP